MKDIFTYPFNQANSYIDPRYGGAGTTVYTTSTVPLNKPVFITDPGDTDFTNAKVFNGFGADGTVLTKNQPAGWSAGSQKTIVWESQPSGTAEFKDSAGAFRRFSDLYAGVYRDWNGGSPTTLPADITVQAAKYCNAFDSFNGGNNVSLDDFYSHPIITHDTTRLSDTCDSSDTDNVAGITITMNGHPFVDGDRVHISDFDGTINSLNGQDKYVDKIDNNTVRLFHDGGLTAPVLRLPQVTLLDQEVQIIDFDASNGENVVYVYMPTVDEYFAGGSFNADTSSGSNIYIDRLDGLGTLYLKSTIQPNWWELHQAATLDNRLTPEEYFNEDYTTFGTTATIQVDTDGNLKLGTNSNRSFAIQYKRANDTFSDTVVGTITGTPIAHTDFFNKVDGNTGIDANKLVLSISKAVTYDGTDTIPGYGRFIRPLFSTNNTHYNHNNLEPTRYGTEGNFYGGRMYFDVRLNDGSHDHAAVAGAQEFYNQTNDKWHRVLNNALTIVNPLGQNDKIAQINTTEHVNEDTDPYGALQSHNHAPTNDNAADTGDFFWNWRYDEREYDIYGIMGDGATTTGGGSRNLQGFEAKEVSFWKRTAYSGAGATIWDRLDTIMTTNLRANVYAHLSRAPCILVPYEKNVVSVVGNTTVEWAEIRCVALPQYGWLQENNELLKTAGTAASGADHDGLGNTATYAEQTFPIDLETNGMLGNTNQANNHSTYKFSEDKFEPVGSSENGTGRTAYSALESVEPLNLETTNLIEFTADNVNNTDTFTITVSNNTSSVVAGTTTGSGIQIDQNLRNGTIIFMNDSQTTAATESDAAFMLILKSVDFYQKEFWVVPTQTTGSLRTFPNPEPLSYYKTCSVANKTKITTKCKSIFDFVPFSDYFDTLTTPKVLKITDSVRYIEVQNQYDIGTADIISVGNAVITDSTTGTLSLNNFSGANFFASNFQAHTFGNQKYLQRTGENTYVNNATLGDFYWHPGGSGDVPWTGNFDTLPTFTFTTNSSGYLTGASIDATATGRVKQGTRLLTVKTVADTYTPPALTDAEAEDTFDTDDEFQDTGFNSGIKTWPSSTDGYYKGPSSIQWRVEMPNSNTTSQSGRTFSRDSGVQTTYLDVAYPALTETQFLPMLRFARAVQGTFNPFYFSLRGANNYRFMAGVGSDLGGLKVLFDANGSKIVTVQGFSSNFIGSFAEGEPIIMHDGKPDGDIKTVINSTNANVFGEARIRLNTPVNTIEAGLDIFKDPSFIIVTLDTDDFVYEQLNDDLYRVAVSFKSDVWRGA